VFDSILPYYNAELRFMRELAKEFARENPKIAARLRMSEEAIEDPHVSRLIEAFAFLNARLRLKLDDDFPELTESLLGLLYPHYLSPIPSMSVVELEPRSSVRGARRIPRGMRLTTEPVDGEVCEYRTGYEVEIWPIALTGAVLTGLPLTAPTNRAASAALSALRLSLRCTTGEQTFVDLGLDRLRFYIHSEPRTSQILYELIVGGTISIALADSAVDDQPVILDRSAIKPVGFSPEDILLPMGHGAQLGYPLLSEYFAFPEKFLFFDITGLTAKTLLNAGATMEIFLYFDRFDQRLEQIVSAADFRLFCTPIINLFEAKADPIRLDPGRFEYRIIPDSRRESTLEVYSVDKVTVSNRQGDELGYRPFYSFGQRQVDRETTPRFWHTLRRESAYLGGGDDVFLSVVDTEGVLEGGDHIASINITATNRNLPARLPFGNGRPALKFHDDGPIEHATCLMAPTRPLRTGKGRANLWKLISQLSLNHVFVSESAVATDVLREVLSLYDTADAASSRALIERLVGVKAVQSVARTPGGGRIAFTSGTDLTLEFEDSRLSGSGAFMLGSVFESVFAGLSAINAFVRVTLKLKNEKGVWHSWKARTGTRTLI